MMSFRAGRIGWVLSVMLILAAGASARGQCEADSFTVTQGTGFGKGLVREGDWLAVLGARDPVDDNYTAFVYERQGAGWVQRVQLQGGDVGLGSAFGSSIDMSGDLLLVGASGLLGSFQNPLGSDPGSAYVFRRQGSTWVQEAKLTASDGAPLDFFGHSVAIDGDRAIIGAIGVDAGGVESTGAAYVFVRSGTTWTQQAKFVDPAVEPVRHFGIQVELAGDLAFVDINAGNQTSRVSVFRPFGSNWVLDSTVSHSGATLLSGRHIVYDPTTSKLLLGGRNPAVYRRSIAGTWSFEQTLTTGAGLHKSRRFGEVVDLRGGVLLVGDPALPYPGPTRAKGAVFAYRLVGTFWTRQRTLVASDTGTNETFGASAALDGTSAIVGSKFQDGTTTSNRGRVYVFNDLARPSVDCIGKGFGDACGIAAGVYEDCNTNALPDRCDLSAETSDDCDRNRVPDECDLDANNDGVPDACQQDCNGNGVTDVIDISSGTSEDCNGNAVPDECELSSGGADCNLNSILDECDIAAGASTDCNGDGTPDECESFVDCNGNTVRDSCDIDVGTSQDCNRDGVPDECQPDEDCNTNGLLDICDIGSGIETDCNGNLVPDVCDIAAGTSLDVNGDGLPDECCFIGAQPLPDLIARPDGAMVQSVKNRFLSFSVPVDTDSPLKAVRVKIVDLWGPWAVLNGTIKWVGVPIASSERGGLPLGDPTGPTFLSARLVDDPVFLDWTVFSVVHVWDEWIIPSRATFAGERRTEPATYWIQTLGQDCGTDEDSFSAPLVVTQPIWGDLSSLSGGEFTAPNGDVDTSDFLAILAKFSGTANAPSKTRAEMLGTGGGGPNGIIDGVTTTSDLLEVLSAFAGGSYPFLPVLPEGSLNSDSASPPSE